MLKKKPIRRSSSQRRKVIRLKSSITLRLPQSQWRLNSQSRIWLTQNNQKVLLRRQLRKSSNTITMIFKAQSSQSQARLLNQQNKLSIPCPSHWRLITRRKRRNRSLSTLSMQRSHCWVLVQNPLRLLLGILRQVMQRLVMEQQGTPQLVIHQQCIRQHMLFLQWALQLNTFLNPKRSILRRTRHHRLQNNSERRQISSKNRRWQCKPKLLI